MLLTLCNFDLSDIFFLHHKSSSYCPAMISSLMQYLFQQDSTNAGLSASGQASPNVGSKVRTKFL